MNFIYLNKYLKKFTVHLVFTSNLKATSQYLNLASPEKKYSHASVLNPFWVHNPRSRQVILLPYTVLSLTGPNSRSKKAIII
jgi:hypothetical protein